jgi:aerotaxis receptor
VLVLLCFMAGVVTAQGWQALTPLEMLTAAGAVLLTSALAHWRIKSVAINPVADLLLHANRMAAGDLTGVITTNRKDVIGQLYGALNQLNVNLRSIVRDARNEVDQMLEATQEMAAGNLDLSGRTEAQASSLEQTAASMEQITGTVRSSADIASEAAGLAAQTTAITQRSSEAVLNVTHTMKAIQASSGRINEIIQVIDSIAFQTNILALNAAVEAARAGEQGRGFAVVASEVRALAQRTATAAKEVKQLITDSAEKVQEGSLLTERAQDTMREALVSVERVSTLVETISHGVREQLSGISQINAAVAQLDTITQQNAAAVEQISASSMALSSRAHVVSDTVKVFHIDNKQLALMPDAVALRKKVKSASPQPASADYEMH